MTSSVSPAASQPRKCCEARWQLRRRPRATTSHTDPGERDRAAVAGTRVRPLALVAVSIPPPCRCPSGLAAFRQHRRARPRLGGLGSRQPSRPSSICDHLRPSTLLPDASALVAVSIHPPCRSPSGLAAFRQHRRARPRHGGLGSRQPSRPSSMSDHRPLLPSSSRQSSKFKRLLLARARRGRRLLPLRRLPCCGCLAAAALWLLLSCVRRWRSARSSALVRRCQWRRACALLRVARWARGHIASYGGRSEQERARRRSAGIGRTHAGCDSRCSRDGVCESAPRRACN